MILQLLLLFPSPFASTLLFVFLLMSSINSIMTMRCKHKVDTEATLKHKPISPDGLK